MVIFGVKCVVVKRGGYDVHGAKQEGARYSEKCAVVKLEEHQQGSTVRVDSGATRGGADESRASAVLLMTTKSAVKIDDAVVVSGVTVRVMKIRQRFTVIGRLDHYQVEGIVEQ